MPELDVLASFVIASLALLLVPGPAVVYVVNRGIADGRRIALLSVLGLTIGNFSHVVLASAGISAILLASPAAFNIVKWLGVAYLVGTGLRTIVSTSKQKEFVGQSIGSSQAFRQGVIVNMLNPKVALFFLAYLPQFVDESQQNHQWSSFLFGSVFVGLGLVTDTLYALVSSAVKKPFLNNKRIIFFRRWVSGTVFVLLGAFAATVSRS